MDLVAVVPTLLSTRQQRRDLRRHLSLSRRHSGAPKLHCVYMAADHLADLHERHPTWTGGRLIQRPLSGVVRAELHRYGFSLYGPPVGDLLAAMPDSAVLDAVREELSGYWQRALGWPTMWLRDGYVDLGLLTMARADAALRDNRLITKTEAIDRLAQLGVPAWLAEQIRRRRRGQHVPMTVLARLHRARIARHLTATLIEHLLEL